MRSGSATLLRRFARQKTGAFTVLHRNASTGRWFRGAAAASNSQATQAQTNSNRHWQSAAAGAAAFILGLSCVAQCEPNQQALDEDLHREEAESPFQLDRAEAPTLRMSSGQMSISFPIRKGIPPTVVTNEIRKQLKSLSEAGGRRYTENQRVDQVSHEMVCLSVPASVIGLTGEFVLKVSMSSPFSSSQQPVVQFVKQGALNEEELAVFSAVLRTANLVTADKVAAAAAAQTHLMKHEKPASSSFDSIPGPPPQTQRGKTRILRPGRLLSEQAKQIGAQNVEDVRTQATLSLEEEWEQLQQTGIRSLMSAFRHIIDDVQDSVRISGELEERRGENGQVRPPSIAQLPQGRRRFQRRQSDGAPEGVEEKFEYGSREAGQAAQTLQSLGAMVYPPANKDTFDWGILAGYADQKQQIEDTMLLALQHPHVYEAIAKSTRRHYSDNKPRAVLFEGPPGTGKTTSARVIASQASVALVYVPLEAVASKWYGESERLLAEVFKAAEMLPGCIIFLDEVDSLAITRSSEMHEATRRLLGVLLRHLDGFETNKRSVVIAATNRKEDLDPALLSRFNTSVQFGLPDTACRTQILHQYAKHLKEEDLAEIAEVTPGLAGRDLKDLSEQAERRWASKIIRSLVPKDQYEPPVGEYIAAAHQRMKEKQGKQRFPFPLH